MNELTNIDTLTAEILILKQQTAQNIVEIGKRLIAVKESLPHGEWGKYLEEKVDFHQTTANRFMRVAEEFSNQASMLSLGTSKLFALLELPSDEREDFVKENPVDDMTTKEFQEAIKEKKKLKQKVNELLTALKKEKDKKAKTVKVEVPPKDYEIIKQRIVQLENSLKLYQNDSMEYTKLKEQIELLKKQKDDFSRRLDSITELSGLVVEVENFLKVKLSPVKYSRSIYEQKHDPIVQENLKDIVNRVQEWCNEMCQLLDDSNFIDVGENLNGE